MNNQLSPTDLAMAQKAQQEVIKAGAVWDFAKGHIAAAYQLGPMDSVDLVTGYITRPEDKALAPEPEVINSPEQTD